MRQALLIVLSFVLLAAGCNFTRSPRRIVQEDKSGSVVYVRRNVHAPPEGYDHPQQISTAAVRTVFSSINLQRYSLLQWKDPYRMFDAGEIRFLGLAVRKALEQAAPDDLVHWTLHRSDRGYGSELTGTICVYRGSFYVEVTKACGEEWDPSKEMADSEKGTSWRLSPGKYQRYETVGGIAGPVNVENKIITPMTKLAMVGVESDFIGATLRQKLKKLKELYEEGLIDEKDYNAEKKKLLEEL